ncbi:hypothetical protein Y1Q_0013182 [Alligator mississippiensis]|uniref:Uncharacterized protein n=1 Tax=Alligator mississippiensis TaxID=8496 RepID=A0A151NKJ5_ALLMI|nr:hypothetical protein Y1Q_0013182 [Alligator mississippiensis]
MEKGNDQPAGESCPTAARSTRSRGSDEKEKSQREPGGGTTGRGGGTRHLQQRFLQEKGDKHHVQSSRTDSSVFHYSIVTSPFAPKDRSLWVYPASHLGAARAPRRLIVPGTPPPQVPSVHSFLQVRSGGHEHSYQICCYISV